MTESEINRTKIQALGASANGSPTGAEWESWRLSAESDEERAYLLDKRDEESSRTNHISRELKSVITTRKLKDRVPAPVR